MSLEHDAQWQDMLQDALDGALSPTELTRFKQHLNDCRPCSADYDRLRLLDARLQRDIDLVPTSLSASFDRQVLAHVARVAAERRARIKQRERQDYALRLSMLKKTLRLNVASWIAALCTVGAALMALDLDAIARFVRDWYSLANPAWAVAAGLVVAAASVCIVRSVDRR